MSKLGVHVSSGNRRGFGDLLQKCAAAGSPVPVVFSVDQDVWPDVEKFSPQTIVVFRHQFKNVHGEGMDGPGAVYVGNPIESARRWMSEQMLSWQKNLAHYYAPLNEQDPPTLEAFAWLNTFTLECLRIADAVGFKLALFGFSGGNPKHLRGDDGQIVATPEQCWHELIPSLQHAKANGHILLLHEYGFDSPAANGGPATSLRASAPWLALRYRDAIRYLHPFEADPPVVIGECGPGVGGFAEISLDAWLADVGWYDSELMRDKIVLGACLYQLGGAENIRDGLSRLGGYIATTQTGEPEGDPVVDTPDDPEPDPDPDPAPVDAVKVIEQVAEKLRAALALCETVTGVT